MKRRQLAFLVFLAATALSWPARGADEPADAFIRRRGAEVIDAARGQPADADPGRVIALVDTKIIPNVDFARMTAAAIGRPWKQATAAQQERLQDGFKLLLVRTYAGALTHLKDQAVTVKPASARCNGRSHRNSSWTPARATLTRPRTPSSSSPM